MNRKVIAATLSTLVAALFLSNARADITTGLVGYWNLSDGPGSSTVADASGNNNTGTLVNFADPTFVNMWSSTVDPTNGWPYALAFNQSGQGTNTYVTIPDSTTLDQPTANKAWTLSAWVYPTVAGASQPNGAGILCKGVMSGTTYAYCLYLINGKFAGALRNTGNTGGVIASNSVAVAANTWYHVVLSVQEPKGAQNSEISLYVNGVLVYGTNSNTFTTVFANSSPVTIGCFSPATLPFQGIIDEARIYNRQLSASDVTQLYQNKAFTLQNGGVGAWNGLAGSGGNATLDATSLNFCTNNYATPLGTPANLTSILSQEAANSLSLGATFSDVYYSNKVRVPVVSSNLTVASGGVAFGSASGAGTMTFLNQLTPYTVSSSDNLGIKDGASPTSLVQSGGGTLILTGTNTFTGGATVNSGIIQLGNGGLITGQELGSATTVTVNGTLAFNGSNPLSYGNTITGNGSIIQKGSGTLTLGANNSYTNSTTINNATLRVSSMGDFGTSSIGSTGPVNLNGGTLVYTGTGESTQRQFNGTPGTTNTIDVPPGVTLELVGRVTSTAAWVVNKVNTGTLTLSGSADNAFLGMNVNAGTVILNKTSGSGHAIGNPLNVASGATVQLAGGGYTAEIFNNSTTPVTISSGGVLDAAGQSDLFFSLSLAGAGIGGTGVLINTASSTLSTLTVATTLAAATTIGGAGSITLQGPVSGPGSLTYAGSTVLTLGAVNTYSGGTTVSSGTLDGNVPGSLPGNVTVAGTGILELDNSSAMAGGATLTLPASPVANSVNLNFSDTQNIGVLIIGSTHMPAGLYGASASNPGGAFTGGGLLNVVEYFWDANGTDAVVATNSNGGGSGSWDNSATDWWTGGHSDTTWAANNNAFFAGTAGVVTLNASETVDGLFFSTAGYRLTNTDGVSALSLAGNTPIIAVPTGTTTISANITGGGSLTGLTVTGPGTLVLSGTNTYTGDTLMNSNATLSVNNISDSGTSALGTSGNLILQTAALNFTGPAAGSTARTVTSVAGNTNSIDVANGVTLTLSGSVNGTATSPINKTDTGTLVLDGTTDNASLGMNIMAGEVIITKSSTANVHGLGGNTSSVASGAELQLAGSGGFDLFNTCVLTVASGGLLDLNGQNDAFSTLTISGTGIANSGALINSASSTTSSVTNGGSGVVLAGPTTIAGVGNITLNSVVSGSGMAITYAGTGTLALTNNNTFSGGITVNPGATVLLTNSVNSGGTGTIADAGTLNVAIVGNNASLTNTITGAGIINIIETPANNLQLGGNLSGFTGTINCPTTPGTTAKAQILTTNVALTSAATINIASGGTFYAANPGVVIPSTINIFGLGNTEVYGALRIESGALISGTVVLMANTTMGNGASGASKLATISGPISQSGGAFGITFTAEPGTIVLSGTNTYAGATTISGGILEIGGSGSLGSGNYAANLTNNSAFQYASSAPQTLSGVVSGTGVMAQTGPGTLTLTGADTYSGGTLITNGTLVIGGSGVLGASTSSNYAGNITNFGTFDYASSAPQNLSGAISGTGLLEQSGPGVLTLSGVNVYTGGTLITNSSTLAVASSGSISTSSSVSIGAGSTFDVSAFGLAYTLSSNTLVTGSGTGTALSSTAANIAGGSGATVNLGAIALNFKPASFAGDLTHPALYVSSGALNLTGSGLAVNNVAATPLGAGTYSLIQVASGNISATSPNVTVTGTGLAAGATASLALSGGSLNLVVSNSAVSHPVISSVTFSGGNIVFGGSNGPNSGTYVVLTSTNVNVPVSNWTAIATNNFASGNFSVTNAASGSRQFFAIKVQ